MCACCLQGVLNMCARCVQGVRKMCARCAQYLCRMYAYVMLFDIIEPHENIAHVGSCNLGIHANVLPGPVLYIENILKINYECIYAGLIKI